MKTQVRQPDPAKEVVPQGTGPWWHNKRKPAPVRLHPSEQRDELNAERELRQLAFVTLGSEPNHTTLKVYVIEGQTSFGETTTLVPCDRVRYPHPFRFLLQRGKDLLVLGVRYAWLLLRRLATYADAFTGINRRKAGLDSFPHHHAKHFDFQECSVPPGSVSAFVWHSAPFHEVAHMRAGQLPRDGDAFLAQERGDIAPSDSVTPMGLRPVTVTLLKIPRHPRVPLFFIGDAMDFRSAQLAAKLVCLARIGRDRMAQAGGLLPAAAVEGNK